MFPREPKVPQPDRFHGDRTRFRIFKAQLNSVFLLNASRFPEDRHKIFYVGSLLGSEAAVWFESHVRRNQDNDEWTYEAFYNEFKTLFSDPLSKVRAQSQIHNLQQKQQSAAKYTMKFMTLAFDSGFNNDALVALMHRNLSNSLKDAIANSPNEPPQDLADFITYVINLDNRQFENRRTRKPDSSRSTYRQDWRRNQPDSAGPVPMEIDSVERSPVPRGPLNRTEKERRRKLGLCLYCGNKGHFASSCPLKPKN